MGKFLVHYGWPEKILTDQENLLRIASLENYVNWHKSRNSVLVLITLKPMDNVSFLTLL